MRAAQYRSRSITLAEGAVVVLFTDGAHEARNRADELFGFDAPRGLIADLDPTGMIAENVVDAGVGAVRDFRGGAEQSDDPAVVVIKAQVMIFVTIHW